MKHGFVKVAAMTPKIKVADPIYNAKEICNGIEEATSKGAKIIAFPELCLTGYTCQDLFLQDTLLSAAEDALRQIVAASDGIDALIFVGLPYEKDGKLYNVAAAINCGELMGFVPKRNIPKTSKRKRGKIIWDLNLKTKILQMLLKIILL